MVEKLNIRVTSFEEFWGDEYISDLYLWEGAKHNLTLEEIDAITCKTVPDKFSGFREIDQAMNFCKGKYFEFIPILSKRLNDFHELNLSDDFWRISFGYWFYRHICVVYEKFAYLSDINFENSSLKLLDEESYFIPKDSIEHFELFGHDFGVQQLVSEYCHLFVPNEFPKLRRTFRELKSDNVPRRKNRKNELQFKMPARLKVLLRKFINPKVVLLNTYYANKHLKRAFLKSWGRIFPINLPNIGGFERRWQIEDRKEIFKVKQVNNKFDQFLLNSLIHGMPTIFIENFKEHYSAYSFDVKSFDFKHIISEGWMGRINVAIYCAIANESGKQLIFQEHASSCSLVKRSFQWFYLSFSNKLITTGWAIKRANVISGGFMARTPPRYIAKRQSQILYVSQSVTPYLMEYSWHPSNSNFLRTLSITREVFNQIPDHLKIVFKYRPRIDITLWDTSYTLGFKGNKDLLDTGAFHDSLLESRIVIIDHLSTAISEVLLMGVPFLLLINPHTEIMEEAKPIFKKLANEGIVHYEPSSLVSMLNSVYGNVQKWWYKDNLQKSVSEIKSIYLGEPQKSFDFLYSLIKRKD